MRVGRQLASRVTSVRVTLERSRIQSALLELAHILSLAVRRLIVRCRQQLAILSVPLLLCHIRFGWTLPKSLAPAVTLEQ